MTHLSCTSEIVQRKSELRYLFTELVTTSTCLFLDLNWYNNLNGKHWMFYLSDTITIKFLRINTQKSSLSQNALWKLRADTLQSIESILTKHTHNDSDVKKSHRNQSAIQTQTLASNLIAYFFLGRRLKKYDGKYIQVAVFNNKFLLKIKPKKEQK